MPFTKPCIASALSLAILLAAGGHAAGQQFGAMDSLAGTAAGRDVTAAPPVYGYDPDLNLMMEQRLAQGIAYDLRYRTLEGHWQRQREQTLESLWRVSSYDFLSKAPEARTGEGLIPDISVPLPGLDRILGSGAQVKINGNQLISIGGEQTVYPNSKSTSELERARSNFDLKIKQEQRINLEGVIGDRVHVLIDHDSRAEIDKKSKVNLRYEGKEDEIIERLEAGDTEFSIQGSSLVGGLSTVHKGLFGVKGVARLGGLEISAIASKDEGQSQSESYSGQNQKDTFDLFDYQYVKHRFFRLPLAPGDSITDLAVYVNDQTQANQTINAWLLDYSWRDFGYDPNRVDTVGTEASPIMLKQNIADYVLDDRRNGILYTRHSLDRSHIMAVAMRVYNPAYGERYYPDNTAFDPNVPYPNLAVIKRSNPQPPDSLGLSGYCWNYEERRFYDLRKPQIIQSSLRVRILKETGSNVVLDRDTLMPGRPTYIHALGLDADDNGEVDPDFLRLGEEGFFYFPHSQPFAMGSLISDPNPAVYSKADPEPGDAKYRISISYLTATAIFNLRAPGRIIDGSVRVYVDGAQLDGSEFQLDYDSGLITFTPGASDKINRPGAQLKIDYQYYPVFALGSKTLAGVRGIYKFDESSHLGATWMYRSERTPEDKPRLGEEPRRIIVAAMDGSFQARPELFTRLADALPLVETEAPSVLRFTGEVAANFPNPNTKGQVYVDDMEGVKLSDEFSLSRLSWHRTGVPVGRQPDRLARRFYWYNPRVYVTQGELNPNLTDPNERSQRVTTLKMHFAPDTAGGPAADSWAGITTVLSKTGLDFTERRLLNVWVKGGQGRLHVDIGKIIHEDQARRSAAGDPVGPDGIVNGEPLDPAGEQVYTDATDVGIDGVRGTDGTGVSGDDGNDDFSVDDSTRMNGSENNGRYDTEDLLLTGKQLGAAYGSVKNDYHSFSFDISGTGWQKLSVVLDSALQTGNIARGDWNNMVYARVWVDGFASAGDVELALVEVSGNRWLSQGVGTPDSTDPVRPEERFDISVKNNRDDADYSQNPPYAAEKDEQGRVKFEQSLVYKVVTLDSGHAASSRRSLRDGERNYTGYRALRLYVRSQAQRAVGGHFYVRLIANDSNNYYEYREPLSSSWRDVSIELDRFSDLKKLTRDSAQSLVSQGGYSMRGNPNLTQLYRLALGVSADQDLLPEDGMEVWFNDLRLDDVRRDGGTAVATRMDLGFADLWDVSLSYNDRASHFYTINDRPPASGSRVQGYGISGNVKLHKFYLERMGLSLPVNWAYSASNSYPEFGREDIRLTEDESRDQASRSRSLSAGASITKSLSKHWLSNMTIDRLSPSLSWSRNTGSDPNSADSSTTLNMGLGYRWSPASRRELKVYRGIKLSYLPTGVSWDWTSSQTRAWRWDKLTDVVTTTGSGRTRTAQAQLGWQPVEQLTYRLGTQRNLLQNRMAGYWAARLGLGSEVGRSQQIDYRTSIKWLKVVQPTVSYSVQYQENHQMYGGQGGADSVDVMATSNANSFGASTGLGMGKWITKMTGLRNEAKDTSAEAGSPRWLVIQMEKFFKRWNGVSVEFSQSKSNASSGLLERPGPLYQVGWQREPGDIARYRQAGADQNSMGNNYSASTQASLGRMNLDLAWRMTDEWRTSGGVSSTRRSVTWPDVRGTLGSLERLGFWRRAMANSSVSGNYSRSADSSWQQGPGFTGKGARHRLGASWNGRWKNQVNSDLAAEYTAEETSEPNQRYPDGIFRKLTTSRKLSTSLSYAFSAPKGLVLNFGRLGKRRFRFTSSLSTSLRAEYTQSEIKSNKPGSREMEASRQTQEFTVAPSASYLFSRSIKGNLAMEYGFNNDRISSVNNWRRFSLNASVDIQF